MHVMVTGMDTPPPAVVKLRCPNVNGPGGYSEPVGDLVFDVVATDFLDLAAQLSC